MRETRYLWVGNLPENIREEKLIEYFKRYGRIERAKILSKRGSDNNFCAVVAFVDIRSAQEAQVSVNMMADRQLQTNYSDPAAMSSSSRHLDTSPSRHSVNSSYHRNYPGHRTDNTRSFEAHSGERGYVTDRYRPPHSTKYRGEYPEPRGTQKHRDLREYDSGSSSNTHSLSKPEKKPSKSDNMKATKKKVKRQQHEEEKPVKKVSKVTKQKVRGRSPVKKTSTKKKVVSSSDEDDEDSSSSYSSGSSQPSSSESSESSSLSSSRSNSSSSSSSRSSVESEQEGQKMVTIIIKKLPSRPSVNSLRDGIYHEFKKCGKVKSVVIRGDNVCRHALVLFRNAAEANKAINHAKTKLLFGAAIEASIYEGEVSGKELQECGGIIDEFHPRASRTLFVGNLDKTVQHSDIQNIFVRFGEILALEIKKQNSIPQYAFLQYTDISSVVKAMQKMDGEKLGRNSLKLGFGKTVMSSCVWVEGVTDSFTEKYLASCFAKYGVMKHVVIDRSLGQALVFYTEYKHSQQAISGMRARNLNGSRLKLDYASHELVDLFLTRMRNSGQSATTFENVRSLLLPAPNAPGVPPSNPSLGGSRSGRSSSGHPYSGGGDGYYDDVHPSRYHGPPHGYDSGAPPRGDWRSWEERNRGRPIYQNMSPRGRRYNDERGPDYYHREDDYYDRVPGSRYDPDYRHPEYRRGHGRDYPPRGYEDYHRGVKQRDRREIFHHSRLGVSPARVIPRRSRSISPRSTGSGGRGRGREFDPKGEARLMDHRDHSAPHARSPIQSPSLREERGSGVDTWSSRKYRDRPSPPATYNRRDDERRVELRDSKSQPSSPRSSSGVVRSKVVHGSPNTQDTAPWTESRVSEQPKQNVEFTETWVDMEYDRSRSETPTRDENLDSIGEVIIKQPSALPEVTTKQEVVKQSADDSEYKKLNSEKTTTPKSRTGSRTSSCQSDVDNVKREKSEGSRADLLQRVRSISPPIDRHRKKHREKDLKRPKSDVKSKPRRASSQNDSDSDHSQQARKKAKPSKGDSYRKPSESHEKTGVSALIKREYSPTGKQRHRQDTTKRSESTHERKVYKAVDDISGKKQNRYLHEAKQSDPMTHKKRRHSQTAKDSEGDSPISYEKARPESCDYEHKSRRHKESSIEPVRSGKRSRRASYKHEAPMPVASQSFQEENEDENASTGMDSDAKEPSSYFRPRIVVKEEVVEVMPEEIDDDEAASPSEQEASFVNEETVEIEEESSSSESEEDESDERNEDKDATTDADKIKRKSRWEPEAVKIPSKVAIAQPFNRAFHPLTSKPIIEGQKVTGEALEESERSSDAGVDQSISEPKKEKLSKLEEEKAKLQALLTKLDSKEKLAEEDANKVADIFISDIRTKLESKLHTKREKEPKRGKVDESEISSLEVRTALEDIVQEETIQEEAIEEIVEIEQAPDIIEEQTIVEEEVSSNEVVCNPEIDSTSAVEVSSYNDVPSDTLFQKHSEVLDSRQGYRKQMEAKRSKEMKKSKDKELHSLLRKQKKERERQKRRIERMRGPSQNIISSIDDAEQEFETDDRSPKESPVLEEQDEDSLRKEAPEDTEKNLYSSLISSQQTLHEEASAPVDEPHKQGVNVCEEVEVDPAVTSHTVPSEQNIGISSEPPKVSTPQACQPIPMERKSDPEQAGKVPFAIPLSRENVTPTNLTPTSSKNDDNSISPLSQIKSHPTNASKPGEKSRQPLKKTPSSSSSPYTPKSSNSSDKLLSQSTESSSVSSSPKVKPTLHIMEHTSSKRSLVSKQDRHSNSDRRPQENMERKHKKAEQANQMGKHPDKHLKSKYSISSRAFTNLTVSSSISPSEPLGKKELETLRAELETMKNQLNREMSPGFLSPSSDNDVNLPPISPILKSPTMEREASLTPDTEGKSCVRPVTSPLFLSSSSPSAITSPVVPASPASSGSSSLTERMKLLVKVRKKAKSEEGSGARKLAEVKEQTEKQKKNEIGNSRFFRSSIFDQDSERLSHLQTTTIPDPSAKETSGRLSLFGGNDLLEDRPLFCSLAEKASQFDSAQNISSTASVSKNAFSLSSELEGPAPAERTSIKTAGRTDSDEPSTDDAPSSHSTVEAEKQTVIVDKPKVAEGNIARSADQSTLNKDVSDQSVSTVQPSVMTNLVTDFNGTGDDVIDVPFNTDEVTVEASDVIIESGYVADTEGKGEKVSTEMEEVAGNEVTMKATELPHPVKVEDLEETTPDAGNSEAIPFQKETVQSEPEIVVGPNDFELDSSNVVSDSDVVSTDVKHESVIYDATEVISTEIVTTHDDIYHAQEVVNGAEQNLVVESKVPVVVEFAGSLNAQDPLELGMPVPVKGLGFIAEQHMDSSVATANLSAKDETKATSRTPESGALERGQSDANKMSMETSPASAAAVEETSEKHDKTVTTLPLKQAEQNKQKSSRSNDSKQSSTDVSKLTKKSDSQSLSHSDVTKKHSSSTLGNKSELKTSKAEASDSKDKKTGSDKRSKSEKVEKLKKEKKEHRKQVASKDSTSKSENKSEKSASKAGITHSGSKLLSEKHSSKTVVKKSEKQVGKSDKYHSPDASSIHPKTTGSEVKAEAYSAKLEQSTKSEKSKLEQKSSQKSKAEKVESCETKTPKSREKVDKPKQHDVVAAKHQKISDKKSKSFSLDSEKKQKASHSDAEKKKDSKLAKHSKDPKDTKSGQAFHKKQKSEEAQKVKISSENKLVKQSSSSSSKKPSGGKTQLKKTKLKSKDSVSSTKPEEKTKIKPKHSKPSAGSEQPVKKRPKLDDSSDFFGKKMAPKVQPKPVSHCFDPDNDFPTKVDSHEQKSKSSKTPSTISSDVDLYSGSRTQLHPKSLSQPIIKSSFISDDSDSEDKYDDFISKIGGGSSTVSSIVERKVPTPTRRPFCSSTDDSDSSESEVTVKKIEPEHKRLEKKQSHKIVKSLDHYDSDKSDKSVSKKSKVKLSQPQLKSKEHKLKQSRESSPYRSEKSKKLLPDKKSKTKGKLKKAEKVENRDFEPEDHHRKLKSRSEKIAKISDSDSGSTDEKSPLEKKASVHLVPMKKTHQKNKKGRDVFAAADVGMQKHKKSKPASFFDDPPSTIKIHEKISHESVRKLSTSSSEEDSLHPPPSPSSSFLTIQTIKDETVVPPEYMDQFSMQDAKPESKPQEISKSTYHEGLAHNIYTSSSSSDSDSDFDDKVFETISKEDSLKFLGEMSESSDSSDEFSDDETIPILDIKSSSKFQVKQVRPENPGPKTLKPKKTLKESVGESDHAKLQSDAFKSFKSSSSKQSEHKKDFSKPYKSHDPKQSVKTGGIKDKKSKQETHFKTGKDKSEASLGKSKPSIKLQDVQKLTKKSKLVEDKHTKDKSIKVVHKDKQPGEKVKKQSEKKTDGAKSSHSEKTHKLGPHDVTKKAPEKQKHHKDVSDPSKPHHQSIGKSKSREQFKSKHTKDAGHGDAKSVKGAKLGQDIMKQKKDSKVKNPNFEKKSNEQKLTVPHEKREKKRSPKPEKSYDAKSVVSKVDEILPPALHIDESPKKISPPKKKDDSMPGKRFFCSDSSSDEDGAFSFTSSRLFIPQSPAHLKEDEEEKKFKPKISTQSPSKHLPSPIKLPSTSPTHQKSLFSPTEDDDTFNEDRISALIKSEETVTSKEHGGSAKTSPRKPSFSLDFGSPSKFKEHSHTRGHSDTEKQSKSDAEMEEMTRKLERGRSRSRDHSPTEKTKRLSSFERYQLKQKQYREHITELKKLSQQRDEEAVRSIMSGDDTTDYLSASASDVPYFGSSGTSSINQPLEVIREKKSEYLPTTTVPEEKVDSTTQHDEQEKTSSTAEVESSPKKVESSTPEPRSTAEEVELAAALRSIEGFGDFTGPAKEEVAPQKVSFQLGFKQPSSTERAPGTPDEPEALTEGSEEAEKATTALLQETDDSFFKSKSSRRSDYSSPEHNKDFTKPPAQVDPPPQNPGVTSLPPTKDNLTISDEPVQPKTSFLSKTANSPIPQQPPKPDPISRFSPTKAKKPKTEKEIFSEAIHRDTKPLSPKLEQPPQEVTSSNAIVTTERDRQLNDQATTPTKCDSTTDIVSDKADDAQPPLATASSKSTEIPKANTPSQPRTITPRPFVTSLTIQKDKPADHQPSGSPTNPTGVMRSSVPAGMHPDLPSTAPTPKPSKDLTPTALRSTEQAMPVSGVSSAHTQVLGPNVDAKITPAQQSPHASSGHNMGPFVPTTHQHAFSQPAWIPRFSPTHPMDHTSHAFVSSTNPSPSGGTFKFLSTQTALTTLTQSLTTQAPFTTTPQVPNISPKVDGPQQAHTPTSANQTQFSMTSKGLSPHPQGQLHPGLPASTPSRPYLPLASPSATQSRTPLTSPKTTVSSTTTPVARSPILPSPVTAGGHILGSGFEQTPGMQVSSYPQSVAMTTVATAPSPSRPSASAMVLSHSRPPQASPPATSIPSEKIQASFEGLQARHPSPQVSHHHLLPTSMPASFSTRHQQPGGSSCQDLKTPPRLPIQAPADPNHNMAQHPPRQPVFYPPGITMLPYGMPGMRHGVPFPRSAPYGGYGLPMSLAHGMNPQQPGQPPGSSHLFQPRTHNPFVDMRSQSPNTQVHPSTNVTHSTLQQPQQQPKGKAAPTSSAPHTQPHKPAASLSGHPEFPVRPQDMRFSYPSGMGEVGRAAMITSSGDSSMDMVTNHFRKSLSGVRPPASQAPLLAGPLTSPGAPGRPSYPPQQYRSPHTDTAMPMGTLPSPQEGMRPPHPIPTSEMYQRVPTPHRGQHIPPQSQSQFWPQSGHPQTGKVEPQLGPGQPQMDIYHQHRGGPPQEPSTVAMKQKPQESSQDPLQDLFERYPVIWQGNLALKNDLAAVQIHYVCGSLAMAQAGLPKHDPNDLASLSVLRIIQRMRINPEQMEPLCRRMARLEEFCVLLALPCGRDKDDVVRQTTALSTGFIQYLQQKQVAGIVNVEGVMESPQQRLMLVLHVFPPCDFTNEHLQFRAPDLLSNVTDIHHLMIVVTAT